MQMWNWSEISANNEYIDDGNIGSAPHFYQNCLVGQLGPPRGFCEAHLLQAYNPSELK